MTENNITPPPELVEQWQKRFEQGADIFQLFTNIFQAGADQELEACIDWISVWHGLEHPELLIELLRAARRPKPPSLKEQALQELEQLRGDANSMGMGFDAPAIRRALEALPDG
jgi:hypothetical protein